MYMFCALWGYGAVFGQALATYAPVPFLGAMGAYRMYVVLFGLVVVPLSTLDVKEQATFQVSEFEHVGRTFIHTCGSRVFGFWLGLAIVCSSLVYSSRA